MDQNPPQTGSQIFNAPVVNMTGTCVRSYELIEISGLHEIASTVTGAGGIIAMSYAPVKQSTWHCDQEFTMAQPEQQKCSNQRNKSEDKN